MENPPTDVDIMYKAEAAAKKHLTKVSLGNA